MRTLGGLEEVHAVDGGGRAHAALTAPAAAAAHAALRIRFDELFRPIETVRLGTPPKDSSEYSTTFERRVSGSVQGKELINSTARDKLLLDLNNNLHTCGKGS